MGKGIALGVAFRFAETNLVCNNLGYNSFVALIIIPGSCLDFAADEHSLSFFEIFADKVGGLSPCDNRDEIARSVFCIPINSKGEGSYRDAAWCLFRFRCGSESAHKNYFIKRCHNILLYVVFIKFSTEVLNRPSVMPHGFFLCICLEFETDLSVLMDAVWLLVVAVVAKPYLESEPFRFVSECLASTPYVMPFQPMPGSADKTFGGVLLNDAFHASPHLDFITASWLGVSVWMPSPFASLTTPSMKMLISRVSNSLDPLYTR